MKRILQNLNDTNEFSLEILEKVKNIKSEKAVVLGLYGNLGAGKTTLTQAIARNIGVSDGVLSPTFVIMKIYQINFASFKNLVHIDAYRIEKDQELTHLGFQEIISNKENLVIIEWPERISNIMPDHIKVKLFVLDENSREILVE